MSRPAIPLGWQGLACVGRIQSTEGCFIDHDRTIEVRLIDGPARMMSSIVKQASSNYFSVDFELSVFRQCFQKCQKGAGRLSLF
jgi:hypothetical protein